MQEIEIHGQVANAYQQIHGGQNGPPGNKKSYVESILQNVS